MNIYVFDIQKMLLFLLFSYILLALFVFIIKRRRKITESSFLILLALALIPIGIANNENSSNTLFTEKITSNEYSSHLEVNKTTDSLITIKSINGMVIINKFWRLPENKMNTFNVKYEADTDSYFLTMNDVSIKVSSEEYEKLLKAKK